MEEEFIRYFNVNLALGQAQILIYLHNMLACNHLFMYNFIVNVVFRKISELCEIACFLCDQFTDKFFLGAICLVF